MTRDLRNPLASAPLVEPEEPTLHAIFHHPLPLDPSRPVASALRPVKMLEAFRDAGYSVDVVAGYAAERRAASEAVVRRLAEGKRYDFMYSESSTLPTLLTEPSRVPTRPSVDFGLMHACQRAGVPVGLFYRDMYWMFPQFKQKYGAVTRRVIEQFYRYDLRRYVSLVDRLYVPSGEMGRVVPLVDQARVTELPPGHDTSVIPTATASPGTLRLLYVGGTGSHYEMGELFKAVEGLDGVTLTICTREADWRTYSSARAEALPPNIAVAHADGTDLDAQYANADVALVFVAPEAYWSFAAPFKLYEYLGKGKPVIASAGTLAARFIESSGSGWSVPYGAAPLRTLLEELRRNPDHVAKRALASRSIAPAHRWESRARTVIDDMRTLRKGAAPVVEV